MGDNLGGVGTGGDLPQVDVEQLLKGPKLVVRKPDYTGNGTFGRVRACFASGYDPYEERLTQGPSDADLRREAAAKLRLQNTFDMEENPLFMFPMAARAIGVDESQVSVINGISKGVGGSIKKTNDTRSSIKMR